MPKANMYQSLHTAVIGPEGQPIEIQIRTEEMHKVAEEGIAAHWDYKGIKGDSKFDRKLSWLKQILDWQRDAITTKEFMEALRVDFFEDEIYVFTPKGRVIRLPKGSTPIDFAYEVHTSLGHTCTGAIVNGRIVPLRHELKNGDIIKVLNSNTPNPHRDWLKIVKTARAKAKIKQFLRSTQAIPVKSVPSVSAEDDGSAKDRLVSIAGINSPIIRLSKCCHPAPGDAIVAYASGHKRVMVHRADCENLYMFAKRKEVKAAWKELKNQPVKIKIIALDRVGLFADILNTVAATGTNVTAAKGKPIGNGIVEVDFGIIAESIDHLKEIIQRVHKLQNIKNVFVENR